MARGTLSRIGVALLGVVVALWWTAALALTDEQRAALAQAIEAGNIEQAVANLLESEGARSPEQQAEIVREIYEVVAATVPDPARRGEIMAAVLDGVGLYVTRTTENREQARQSIERAAAEVLSLSEEPQEFFTALFESVQTRAIAGTTPASGDVAIATAAVVSDAERFPTVTETARRTARQLAFTEFVEREVQPAAGPRAGPPPGAPPAVRPPAIVPPVSPERPVASPS